MLRVLFFFIFRAKITTAEQFNFMLNFFEEQPDLASGRLNCVRGKEKSDQLWTNVTDSLNSLGPPIRSMEGWKKIWADLKSKTRNKMRKQIEDRKKTGGGPSSAKPLSALEERILTVTNLNLSVTGCIGAVDFGHNLENVDPVNQSSDEFNSSLPSTSATTDTSTPIFSRAKKTPKRKADEVIRILKSHEEQNSAHFSKIVGIFNDIKHIQEKRLKIDEENLKRSTENQAILTDILRKMNGQ